MDEKNNLSENIVFRVSEAENEMVKKAAKQKKMSKSKFLRFMILAFSNEAALTEVSYVRPKSNLAETNVPH